MCYRNASKTKPPLHIFPLATLSWHMFLKEHGHVDLPVGLAVRERNVLITPDVPNPTEGKIWAFSLKKFWGQIKIQEGVNKEEKFKRETGTVLQPIGLLKKSQTKMGNYSTQFIPSLCNKIRYFFGLHEKFLFYLTFYTGSYCFTFCVRNTKLTYYAYTFFEYLEKIELST